MVMATLGREGRRGRGLRVHVGSSWDLTPGPRWSGLPAARRSRPAWRGGRGSCCWPLLGCRCATSARRWASSATSYATGWTASGPRGWTACAIGHGPVGGRSFPPEVALHTVRLACELPDLVGRSLSQWDCTELARQLIRAAIVETISPRTVQRILASRRLKPWRVHA